MYDNIGAHLAVMSGVVSRYSTRFNQVYTNMEGNIGPSLFDSSISAVHSSALPAEFLTMDEEQRDLPNTMFTIIHDAMNSPESELIGGPLQEYPKRAREASVMHYVGYSNTIPPMYLIHDREDRLLPYTQTQNLDNLLVSKSFSSKVDIKDDGLSHRNYFFTNAVTTWFINQSCA